MKEQFLSDIPLETAIAAHNGTSHSPEQRGVQEREAYANQLVKDHEALSQHADTDEKRATLAEEFQRYREGYRRHTLDYLGSRSRVMSTMITGPANFPAARNAKRGAAAQRKLQDLLDFRNRALQAITKKLRPELRPIMAGDGDALERLAAEIAEAEAKQERMKKANAIIRKFRRPEDHHDGRLALEHAGFTAGQAARLFTPDDLGSLGYRPWELSNNNANIRRMKERLVALQAAKAKPVAQAQGEHARYEDDAPANRVRLIFPGKPSEEIRSRMKSCGFRWSPTAGAWQAYRNERTLRMAKEIAGVSA